MGLNNDPAMTVLGKIVGSVIVVALTVVIVVLAVKTVSWVIGL